MYITNPIKNEKSKLAFRGIIIKENNRQAQILNSMTELEKTLHEVTEMNRKSAQVKEILL